MVTGAQEAGRTGGRGRAAALGAALLLFATAAALTYRVLSAPPEKKATDPETAMVPADSSRALHDRKTAAELGYPALPGAYGFHSMEAPDGSGSVAYMVKPATADGVVRFYVERLGTAGWQFQDRAKSSMRPSGPKAGPLFSGYRARWTSADNRKSLLLWALDDPQRPGGAQVVVSWKQRR